MIYALGAILIYMLFINPDLFMAKWLVIGVSRVCVCVCVCVGVCMGECVCKAYALCAKT